MGLSEDDYEWVSQQGNRSAESIRTVDSGKIYFPLFPLGFAVLTVTVLGIAGNLISSFVLTRKRLRSSSYSVLTLALTVVDTIYLLTKLIRYGLLSLFSHFNIFYEYTNIFLPVWGPFLRPVTFTAHTASTYLTMAIALDRYLIVARPHTARHYCTTRLAKIFSLITIAFAIVYNIPRWFEFHTTTFDGRDGEIRYQMEISSLRTNQEYRKYYIFWTYIIIMFFIPFATLLLINLRVWMGVKAIKESGLTLTYTQSRDTSFSTMLVGVVVVFLICNLDYLVLDLMDYFGFEYPTYWNDVGNFLLTVNSAVNFLIYCLCGRKFRDELRAILQLACFDCQRNLGTQSHDIFTTTGVWIKDIPRRDKNRANARITLSNNE